MTSSRGYKVVTLKTLVNSACRALLLIQHVSVPHLLLPHDHHPNAFSPPHGWMLQNVVKGEELLM